MRNTIKLITIMLTIFLLISTAFAHSGRTDKNGCHTNHKTGVYHCHLPKK